jgi:acylphosphatase
VEICAEGEAQALERLEEWAWQGPPAAEVEEVQAEYSEPMHTFKDFSIR